VILCWCFAAPSELEPAGKRRWESRRRLVFAGGGKRCTNVPSQKEGQHSNDQPPTRSPGLGSPKQAEDERAGDHLHRPVSRVADELRRRQEASGRQGAPEATINDITSVAPKDATDLGVSGPCPSPSPASAKQSPVYAKFSQGAPGLSCRVDPFVLSEAACRLLSDRREQTRCSQSGMGQRNRRGVRVFVMFPRLVSQADGPRSRGGSAKRTLLCPRCQVCCRLVVVRSRTRDGTPSELLGRPPTRKKKVNRNPVR
jgi:hypothetical protein